MNSDDRTTNERFSIVQVWHVSLKALCQCSHRKQQPDSLPQADRTDQHNTTKPTIHTWKAIATCTMYDNWWQNSGSLRRA